MRQEQGKAVTNELPQAMAGSHRCPILVHSDPCKDNLETAEMGRWEKSYTAGVKSYSHKAEQVRLWKEWPTFLLKAGGWSHHPSSIVCRFQVHHGDTLPLWMTSLQVRNPDSGPQACPCFSILPDIDMTLLFTSCPSGPCLALIDMSDRT